MIFSHYFPDNCKLLLRKIRGKHLYTDVNFMNCAGARTSNYRSRTARTHSSYTCIMRSFIFIAYQWNTMCLLIFTAYQRNITREANHLPTHFTYCMNIPYSSHISASSLSFLNTSLINYSENILILIFVSTWPLALLARNSKKTVLRIRIRLEPFHFSHPDPAYQKS